MTPDKPNPSIPLNFADEETSPSSTPTTGNPAYDPRQKHRFLERKALAKLIADYNANPDSPSTNPDAILARWDSGIADQLHFGPWDSICPLLDAVRGSRKTLPQLTSRGVVFFGSWFGKPDLEKAVPIPDNLFRLVADYGIYWHTVKQTENLPSNPSAAQLKRINEWLEKYPRLFSGMDWGKARKKALAWLDLHQHVIINRCNNLPDTTFAFVPDTDKPGAGWDKFFAFYAGYCRQPRNFFSLFTAHHFAVLTKAAETPPALG